MSDTTPQYENVYSVRVEAGFINPSRTVLGDSAKDAIQKVERLAEADNPTIKSVEKETRVIVEVEDDA